MDLQNSRFRGKNKHGKKSLDRKHKSRNQIAIHAPTKSGSTDWKISDGA